MSKEKGKNEYGAFWARFKDKSKDTPKGKVPVATLRRESSSSFDVDSIKTESSAAPQKRPKRKRAVIKNDEFDQLPMCGVTVRLPVGLKPYPSQKLIMVRILTAIKNNMNVLAESPTGSGKTMALLASTCAWLRMYQDDRKLARSKCEIHGDEAQIVKTEPLAVHKNEPEATSDPQIKQENTVENQWIEDFIPHGGQENVKKEEPIEGTKTEEPVCTCLPRVRIYYGTRTHKQIAQVVKEFGRLPYAGIIKHTILASREQSCINPAARRSPDISQFCKEVNGTDGIGCSFKTAMRNRYEKASALRSHLEYNGTVVFDTEEIVETLAQSSPQLCPYFCTTRVLTQDADLIFCPFSYLVDPIIRNSSDVHVKNAIVVLDEAHNIEDTCRDAASFVFSEKELDDALLSFRIKKNAIDQEIESGLSHNGADTFEERVNDKMATLKEMRSNLMLLEHLMLEILRWVRKLATGAKEKGRDGTKSSTLTSSSLFGSLTDVESGIDLYTPQNTPRYTAISGAFNALAARNEAEMQYFDAYKPSATAIVCIEKWLYFQSYFGQPDYQKTYRCNLTIEPIQQKTSYFKGGRNAVDLNNTMEYRQKGAGPRNMKYADDDFSNDSYDVHNSTWLNTSGAAPSSDSDTKWIDTDKPPSGHQPIAPGCKTTVSLWCMSPALSFVDAFSQSRSVILASGTLCPMDTLKTELGMEFKQQMEGSQVISKDRIFAAVLPVGPGGNRIQCTYRHTSDENSPFYSELGAIIQFVCSNISAGILCFLPSYRVLDQLKNHLEKSSRMKSIESKKVVLCEPRRSSELAQVMLEYDKAIAQPKYFGPTINGALMFAVFRGKVSEGIDFADDRARVVISVGIPFPSSTDELVTAKRIYNDENSKTLGILNGEEWYVTQAYRALNQALGRCLRHKNDWGAMLMIDERLERQSKNITTGAASARVSKWIREQLKSYPNFQNFNDEFREFYIRMRNEDVECSAASSSSAATADVKKEIKTEDG
ncbi:unnamed protein product [Caenorhabditis angaria]|uniref:Helicase ATP-binding domain-containing protein n=1 Tax=Caenorhabditis angaria TaxID=860376 RepID=A0A9P1I7C0_9PELO|nr:unnamed protein product [Caenorhabditis angaria]